MAGGTKASGLDVNTSVTDAFRFYAIDADGRSCTVTVSELMSDTGAVGVSTDSDNALSVGADGRPYLSTGSLGGEGSDPLVLSVNGDTGNVTVTLADLSGVPLASFTAAHTLLVGTAAGAASAVAIAEDRVPIRLSGESLKGGTATELRTFLNVEDGATADMAGADIITALTATAEAFRTFLNAEAKVLTYADQPTSESIPIFAADSAEVSEWQTLEALDVTASSFMATDASDPPEIVQITPASALVRLGGGFSEVSVTGTGEKDIAVAASDNAVVITPVGGNITLDQVTGLTFIGQSIPVYLEQDSSDRTVTLAGTSNAVLADSDALDIPTGGGSRGRALLVADRTSGGGITPTFYKVSGPT